MLMAETPSTGSHATQTTAAPAQKKKDASPFGHPASELRIILPVLIFVVVAAVGYLLMVLLPVSETVSTEPDHKIYAVLADFRLMLNIRFWPVLLGAGLLAAGIAGMTARRIAQSHNLLEKRLRKLASGEFDDTEFSPSNEFPQFQEVLLTLHYAQEQARKKGRGTLLQAEGTIDKLVRRLVNEDVSKVEIQKALAGIQTELNTLLEASRPPGSGKPK
jgi:hypothetical protein